MNEITTTISELLATSKQIAESAQRVAHIAPRGLLLIAPSDDRTVSPAQSQRIFDAAGEPKELLIVEGAAHADAHGAAPEEYERRVLGFLARHLDGVSPV